MKKRFGRGREVDVACREVELGVVKGWKFGGLDEGKREWPKKMRKAIITKELTIRNLGY
jgi:hypothetical protein